MIDCVYVLCSGQGADIGISYPSKINLGAIKDHGEI
jgi:hypothetical protein